MAGPCLRAFQRAWIWWWQRGRAGFEDQVFLTPELGWAAGRTFLLGSSIYPQFNTP